MSFSFFVGNVSDSVIVSINKIGSLANGSILATFLLAILTTRATDVGTVVGIFAGFFVNLYLWLFVPSVSWLWWNAIGCLVTFAVGYLVSLGGTRVDSEKIKNLVWFKGIGKTYFNYQRNWNIYYGILALWFFVMIGILSLL